MVKIKRKKKMTLPELIEWSWENDVREEWFYTDNQAQKSYYGVQFDEDGDFISRSALNCDLLFTVDIEEEITEHTKIENLLELQAGDEFFWCCDSSIERSKGSSSKAFYIANDDMTLTLIWKDGKIVE